MYTPASSAPINVPASPSRRTKRKSRDDDEDASQGSFVFPQQNAAGLTDICRKAVVRRRSTHLDGSNDMAEFYPLPDELNHAVLASLGVGSSRRRDSATFISAQAWDPLTSRPSPGLLQPSSLPASDTHHASQAMEEDSSFASKHGPQCQSIPRLSVRYFGGTRSQLWAYCPDCHAFSKVHEGQPADLSYSP